MSNPPTWAEFSCIADNDDSLVVDVLDGGGVNFMIEHAGEIAGTVCLSPHDAAVVASMMHSAPSAGTEET